MKLLFTNILHLSVRPPGSSGTLENSRFRFTLYTNWSENDQKVYSIWLKHPVSKTSGDFYQYCWIRAEPRIWHKLWSFRFQSSLLSLLYKTCFALRCYANTGITHDEFTEQTRLQIIPWTIQNWEGLLNLNTFTVPSYNWCYEFG